MPLRVAIIGAGVSGLTTLKECLAQGFSATVFEALDHIGGQWHFDRPDTTTGEVHSSIYEGVILNSCRDTTGFSDFPLDPARYPDYFGHKLFLEYINDYVEAFGLGKKVRLNTKVLTCKQLDSSQWRVSYQERGCAAVEDSFDAIFASTGHNTLPMIPKYEGLESFQGLFMHSHAYRTPGQFEGKRVAIIGVGSSAVDIASEMCAQTKELHLITRRGGWVIPRYVLGLPVEAFDSRLAQTVLPASFAQWTQTKLLNFVQGKHPPELQPEHGIMEANPTVRGDFLENARTGRIKVHRAGIERITRNGLILSGGTNLEVDVIVSCTGYYIDLQFLPEDSYRAKGEESPNAMDLYKLVISPQYQNLFFIGFVEAAGPLLPIAEMQARWCAGVLSKQVTLPSQDEMSKWISIFHKNLDSNFVKSDRHKFSIFYLPYCDELARDLNAAPSFGRLVRNIFTSNPIRALSVLNAVYMHMASASQYRLFGSESCPDLATATILRIAKRGKTLSEIEEVWLQALHQKEEGKENAPDRFSL